MLLDVQPPVGCGIEGGPHVEGDMGIGCCRSSLGGLPACGIRGQPGEQHPVGVIGRESPHLRAERPDEDLRRDRLAQFGDGVADECEGARGRASRADAQDETVLRKPARVDRGRDLGGSVGGRRG